MPSILSRVLMSNSAGLYPPIGSKASNGKRSRRTRKTATRTVRRTRRKSGGRLVKGSAAAKAYMAKIRRKRR
jgi:hypothetical protein